MRPIPSRRRLPGWDLRLAELVEARRHAGFAWGVHDCTTFAADGALAITGSDPIAPWRGSYLTEDEGRAVLAPWGGLEAFLASELPKWGAPECPPAFVQRGDWALVSLGNELVCGLVLGDVVAAPAMDRLAFVPSRRIIRAWAV
jgi:hypothetical protein